MAAVVFKLRSNSPLAEDGLASDTKLRNYGLILLRASLKEDGVYHHKIQNPSTVIQNKDGNTTIDIGCLVWPWYAW